MSYQQEMLYNMVQGLADEGPLRDRLVGVATYLAPRIVGKFHAEPVMQEKLKKNSRPPLACPGRVRR